MKAVILAAGKGKRMGSLTSLTPKPMLKVMNEPILSHVIRALSEEINEVILVVKYLDQGIKDYFGDEFLGRKIFYAEGSELGTAYSFLAAKNFVEKEDKFLVLYGDDLVNRENIKACLHEPLAIIVFETHTPQNSGIIEIDENGYIKSIIEKPIKPVSFLAIGGIMILNYHIFDYKPFLLGNEFYLSSMLSQFVRDFKVKAVFTDKFLGDITRPEDLLRAEKIFQGGK